MSHDDTVQFWGELCALLSEHGLTILAASSDASVMIANIPGSSLLRAFTWAHGEFVEVEVRTLPEAPKTLIEAQKAAQTFLEYLERGELWPFYQKQVIEQNSLIPKGALHVVRTGSIHVFRCSPIAMYGTPSKFAMKNTTVTTSSDERVLNDN